MPNLNPLRVFRGLPPAAYLSSLAHFTLEFSNNFMPIVYPLLIVSMGLSYAQVGRVVLVGSLFGTLFQPIFGHLSDRWGSRNLIILSIAWIGTWMGLVGFATEYWMLFVLVSMGALGSAAYHPPGAAIASQGGITRRGAAMAVFSVGGNLGSALSPLVIGFVIASIGLPGTALVMPIAWLVTGLLLLRFRLPKTRKLPAPSEPQTAEQTRQRNGSIMVLALIVFSVGARAWFQGALITYLPVLLQSQGLTLAAAGGILSVLLVSISVGSLMGGSLSDKVGRLPVLLVSLAALGPVLWLFFQIDGPIGLVFLSLTGFLIGATFPVTILMAQDAWPQGPGLASSLAIGIGWLPAGIGAWVVGLLADQSGLTAALQTLVYVPFFGLIAALVLAWRVRKGNNPHPLNL